MPSRPKTTCFIHNFRRGVCATIGHYRGATTLPFVLREVNARAVDTRNLRVLNGTVRRGAVGLLTLLRTVEDTMWSQGRGNLALALATTHATFAGGGNRIFPSLSKTDLTNTEEL
ncbi:hypothetical protein J6590_017121 [Homalodisca vitripennis]|nr:hypothetical protein J6590_017121 [Homalodisca vitripennis]